MKAAIAHLRDRGVDDLASVTLISDGSSVYEITSADDLIDLLAGGQGVFAIAVGPVASETRGRLAQLPSEAPPAKAVAAIVALGALSTGVAYLLYFTLIARAGASRAILVTYLVPAFALVYGTVFLDEAVTVSALVGLVLILGGTALGTGTRLRRG